MKPDSIAEELELEPGDVLLAINGQEIEDVFDYHYYVNDEVPDSSGGEGRRGRVGAGD